MNTLESRLRLQVDRMLAEAAAVERYLAAGQVGFFDIRTPEIRDSVELRVLHFAETATRIGRSFRGMNPAIPWNEIDQLRNDLVHEYPQVRPERVWRFAHDDLPPIVKKLRRAKFSGDE